MSDIVIRVVVDPAPAVSGSAQVNVALDGVRAKAAETTNEMDRMVKAFIATRVIKELEHLSDGFTEVQNRIRTVTTSEEEMVRISNQLFEVAQQTRTSWGDTAATFQRVTQATHELGLSQQQVIDFTRQLNEAFIISGVSAGEQSRVTRDLLHGLDQGTLAWRQLLPIMSQAPSVARIIAEHFHVTTGELHALATAGKITGHEIIAAFSEANDSLEAGFGKTVPTIAQMMTTLRNAAEKFIGELMHGSIVVGVMGSAMAFLVEHFDTVGKVLVVLADVLLVKYAYTAIPAAITATEAFTIALMENPLFLGIAVVSAIYLFRDAIGDAIKSIWDFAKSIPIVGDALDRLVWTLGLIWDAGKLVVEAAEALYDAFQTGAEAVRQMGEALEWLAGATIGLVIAGLQELGSALYTLIEPFVVLGEVIVEVTMGLAEGLIGVLGDAISYVVSGLGDLASGIGTAMSLLVDFAAGVVEFGADLIGLIPGVSELVEGLSYMASGIGDLIGGIGTAISVVSDLALGIGEGLVGALSDLGDWLSGNISEGLDSLTAAMGGARQATLAEILALTRLGFELDKTANLARSFVGVDIVRKTTEIVAAINLVVQLQREVQIAQVAAAKVFATDLVDSTKRAGKAAEEARRAAEAWARETKALTDEINRMRGAVSPATKANLELAEAIETVTRAEQRHILSVAEGNRLIQARTIAIALEQMAADEQINRQTSIVDLLEKEAEARAKVEAAKKKKETKDNTPKDTTPPDHALSTVEDIQRAMDELAKTTDHTVVNAIHNVAQAFAELATTGKFNWRSLTDSILSDITSMIARMLEMKLLSLALGLFGGGGAAAGGTIDYFASQASGTPVYGGAHADGGSVTVPGVGGADSVPMLFHLTPGERVDFTPPGMQRGAAAAGAPDVQIHNQVVISPDFVPSMMATPAGHRAMMDFVRVNARQIAQLTQG